MPHHFVNRLRDYEVSGDDRGLRNVLRWEQFNALAYEVGGVVFMLGSILFFPAMDAHADMGAWVFILGSALYLVVTGHDMLEVVRHMRIHRKSATIWDHFEFAAASSYLIGTLLFTIGSVFFLSRVGLGTAGAWCFVIGSLLFVVGATINVLQIVQAPDIVTLQLMNLTALSFVTGSVLFTVASVPYLWSVDTAHDKRLIDGFLAWQYLIGSALFFLGGVVNHRRAWMVAFKAR